jgi:hypothetical protein
MAARKKDISARDVSTGLSLTDDVSFDDFSANAIFANNG